MMLTKLNVNTLQIMPNTWLNIVPLLPSSDEIS